MNKIIDAVLVVGFVVADFLIFHDYFKVGEAVTPVQCLVGVLSVIVIVRSIVSIAFESPRTS